MAYSDRAGDNLVLEEIVFSGAHFEYSAHFNILPLDVFSEEKNLNYYFICNNFGGRFPISRFNFKFPICHFMASKPPDNNTFSTYKIPLIQKSKLSMSSHPPVLSTSSSQRSLVIQPQGPLKRPAEGDHDAAEPAKVARIT